VFYQPQLDLATGRIKGMEALARWRHPELGLVSPARFIPIAEETGQIVEIGMWVLREACRQAQEWNAAGNAGLVVAVNVSAKQFDHDGFAGQVRQVLHETGLPPHQLELEITESVIMNRPDHVVNVMKTLREVGVRFSIDDFGTGYSSLSQLKRFPIDTLKIDQSFTRDIGLDEGGTAITRAVIALGHSLRLQVVAEGVETEEQQRFLAQHGCHGMQGYLFSRPVEASAFKTLLALHLKTEDEPEWQI
jgi:EAL domain-containing protein (putative c-di-GMP-specific phosphodiesterase class I)